MGYTLVSVLLLILIHIFQPHILTIYNPENYLGFHTILEVLSITLSAYIFLYGWRMFATTKMRSYLILATIFFLVGMIDLFHTLTFNGMPYFFSDSSIPKATWFWVIARSIESIFILIFLLLPNKQLKRDNRPIVLTLSCLIIFAIVGFIFTFENSLPALVIEGKGTTFLKNIIEYFISFLHFVAIVLMLYRYYINKKESYLNNALAFTFLFLSELVFTIYQSVYDLDNFIGHIFKVCGYYFIVKGFFYQPSSQVAKSEEAIKEGELKHIVNEHDGLLFRFTKVEEEYIHTYCNGGLFNVLQLSSTDVVGKSIHDIIPVDGEYIIHYYYMAWNKGEIVRFPVDIDNQTFFVSLKPVVIDGEVTEVIGSAFDMTEALNHRRHVSSF
jgi:PAS domain-containing protein